MRARVITIAAADLDLVARVRSVAGCGRPCRPIGAVKRDGDYAAFFAGPQGIDVDRSRRIRSYTVNARGDVVQFSGTSYSAALAAALVTTALAPRPVLSNEQIRAALAPSSEPATGDGPPVLRADKLRRALTGEGGGGVTESLPPVKTSPTRACSTVGNRHILLRCLNTPSLSIACQEIRAKFVRCPGRLLCC